MQNGLSDVFALLKFLRHEPWAEALWWQRVVQAPWDERADRAALARLKAILAPLMLRRTKACRGADGRPIVELPPKDVETLYVELSDGERAFHDAVRKAARAEFEGLELAGALASYTCSRCCSTCARRAATRTS